MVISSSGFQGLATGSAMFAVLTSTLFVLDCCRVSLKVGTYLADLGFSSSTINVPACHHPETAGGIS
jgi:hypothetical protein